MALAVLMAVIPFAAPSIIFGMNFSFSASWKVKKTQVVICISRTLITTSGTGMGVAAAWQGNAPSSSHGKRIGRPFKHREIITLWRPGTILSGYKYFTQGA